MVHTKKRLEEAVKNSTSFGQVLDHLGLKRAGGSQGYIKKLVIRFEIDTRHFLGQRSNSGEGHRGGPKKKTWKEILIKEERVQRVKSFVLRRALLEMGRSYCCEGCGNEGEWLGKELRLQIDHRNGDWCDNRPDNLAFLCPNCHSQTEGWSNSQGFTGIADRDEGYRQARLKKKKAA